MAHVEKRRRTRDDGTTGWSWRARYIDPDGRERSHTFARRTDAERFLTTVEASKLTGGYIDPRAGRVTFASFAASWLAAQTFEESTREAVASRLRAHLLPTFAGQELRAIRPSGVQAWLRGLQQQLAPTYVRVLLANLSAILSAAVEDGLITRNPCSTRAVRAPRAPQGRLVPWTVERVKTVTAALPDRYRTLPIVAAGCGLRQGEVFGLRVQDVDFLRRKLRVEHQVKIVGSRIVLALPKGSKTREVPLPDVVAVALAEHLRQYPAGEDGLIFTSRQGKPLDRNYINSHIWKPALKRSGVEPTRDNGMHALRHAYASVLLDAGESIKAVADYLGHTDPGFTLRVYTHLLPASEDRTRRAIDSAFGAGTAPARPGDAAKG